MLVDGVYYLVTSTFEYLPAMPVYRSTDFVRWEHIGNVTDDPDVAGLGEARSGMGVWAPTIRHRDGKFYVIVTVAASTRGCVVFRSADPATGWDDGTTIDGIDGIDPDLAWDEDGVAYVTYSALRLTGARIGQHDGIEQARVDLDAGRRAEVPRSLWSGTGLQFPEAPHLYLRDGWWYLIIAEGGTERGHAVSVARSRSITGPFEGAPLNPILSASGTTNSVQNTGHADLVEGPDGTDLFVLLGVRPLGAAYKFSPLGRETFVTPVQWTRGWPGAAPIKSAPQRDDFHEQFPLAADAELDDPGWLAVAAPPRQYGTITDERLVMTGMGGALTDPRPTFIGRRQRHFNSATTITLRPGDGQGGLALRYDERFHLTVSARAVTDGLEVTARAVLPTLQQVWTQTLAGARVTLHIRTRTPARTDDNDGAGGDIITLEVASAGGPTILLAEVDGRFWSAETAGSFAGRVVGPFADIGTVEFTDYTYRGNDSQSPA